MKENEASDLIRRHLEATAMLLRSLPEEDARLLISRFGIGVPPMNAKEIAVDRKNRKVKNAGGAGYVRDRIERAIGELAKMFSTVLLEREAKQG